MKTCMLIVWILALTSSTLWAQLPTTGEADWQRELTDLRAELKSLRLEHQNLARTLDQNASGRNDEARAEPADHEDSVASTPASEIFYMPSRVKNPKEEVRLELEETPCVELSVDDCVLLALHNAAKKAERGQEPSVNESSRSEIVYRTKEAFWQLWGTHRHWDIVRDRHISTLALHENWERDKRLPREFMPSVTGYVVRSLPSQRLNTYGNVPEPIVRVIKRFEDQLRVEIGWTKANERQVTIKPVVARAEIAQWPHSWETTRCLAMENNPELRTLKRLLADSVIELIKARREPGFDRLALRSVKLAEEVRAQELAVGHELVDKWRLLDSERSQALLFQEQAAALDAEIRFYREKWWDANCDRSQTAELVMRAQERLDDAMRRYWMTIQESHKCVASLEYLCGEQDKP